MVRLFWHVKKNSVRIFAGKFSQTIMTIEKSQSFCGGQNGLTILAKIFFESLENIFDYLVGLYWPILFWESYEFFVAKMQMNALSANGPILAHTYHFLWSIKFFMFQSERRKYGGPIWNGWRYECLCWRYWIQPSHKTFVLYNKTFLWQDCNVGQYFGR